MQRQRNREIFSQLLYTFLQSNCLMFQGLKAKRGVKKKQLHQCEYGLKRVSQRNVVRGWDRQCALVVVHQVCNSSSVRIKKTKRQPEQVSSSLWMWQSGVWWTGQQGVGWGCVWEWGKRSNKPMNRKWAAGMKICAVLEGEIRRTKEDRERTEGGIYGCSSFFFSEIRFFLAASIS